MCSFCPFKQPDYTAPIFRPDVTIASSELFKFTVCKC